MLSARTTACKTCTKQNRKTGTHIWWILQTGNISQTGASSDALWQRASSALPGCNVHPLFWHLFLPLCILLQVSTSSWSAVLVYLVWCLTHAEMVMTWFDIVRCTTGLTWSLRDVFLFDKVSPVQVSRSIEARNSNPIRISVDTMHLRSLRLSDFKTLTYGHIILTYFYHGLSSRQVCLKPLRNEPTLITACLGFHTSFSITRSWLTVYIHAWHSTSFRSMSQLAPCSLLLRSLSWNVC